MCINTFAHAYMMIRRSYLIAFVSSNNRVSAMKLVLVWAKSFYTTYVCNVHYRFKQRVWCKVKVLVDDTTDEIGRKCETTKSKFEDVIFT